MNKKKAQRIHAKTRAWQRYGIILNRDDLFAIVRMIQSQRATQRDNSESDNSVLFLERKSNRITIYQVKYLTHNLVVAYDKERHSIASFLPADAEEVNNMEINDE